MKTLLASFAIFTLALVSLRAEEPRVAALQAADDERVAAMKAPERARLAAIFSDDLRYAHSSGAVDTKDSFTEALTAGRTKYQSYDYEERNFTFPAPGVALMTGRTKVKVVSATGEVNMTLGFLAVWREEQGHWRFLAWQSCKLPTPAN
jgi:hypothetical protein